MTTECSSVFVDPPVPLAPASGPSAWTNVFSGRYRITGWYDRGVRRYIVAKPNAVRSPRPLTERQRRMLALRARDTSLKVIAFEFGVSIGTVSRDLTQALGQIGLESSADLAAVLGMSDAVDGAGAALVPPPPAGLALEQPEAPDSEDLVLSFPLGGKPEFSGNLTSAQRDVIDGLLRGLSNVEIAERRGVSPFTVANQIASIFSKLGVHSRLGLALLMRRAA